MDTVGPVTGGQATSDQTYPEQQWVLGDPLDGLEEERANGVITLASQQHCSLQEEPTHGLACKDVHS